ncbi:transketolase [Acuticoccus mangrovi]|uniref:Transketolase n=1 Tax=Acuticoccus mangrovi TaxID=2796142 RepID=A0A934MBY6_9HYPH|nr:transketolase [Acuticoccus mangrovi]MBJ3774672.1 transketolase [Acuticoccus mangrovi]
MSIAQAHPPETGPANFAFLNADELAAEAKVVRRNVLTTIQAAGIGHVGGDMSVTDILVTLFFGVMKLDPAHPDMVDRDRFILSKGHCAASLYSVLARRGFIEESALATFAKPLSALNGHPNRRKVPGVEANTGPLGHGLPIAVGTAIGAGIRGLDYRAFVVTGDGELQEGSNWEAAMYAGHRKLSNLTAIVDRNRLQQGARTADTNELSRLGDKFDAFGWEVREIDGHDYTQLLDALGRPGEGKPVFVLANTTKGRGVSFMEDRVEWHHKVPSDAEVVEALKELA